MDSGVSTRKFSRDHLLELREKFNQNLVSIRKTLDGIRMDFVSICEQWQGGQNEDAKISIDRINEAFAKIEADLTEADKFINDKAEGFNLTRFTA